MARVLMFGLILFKATAMRMDDKKYTWGDAGKNGFAPNDGCDFCGSLLNNCAKVFRNYSHQGQRREAFCSEYCKNNYNQIPNVERSYSA
jgi:hypothetical protein